MTRRVATRKKTKTGSTTQHNPAPKETRSADISVLILAILENRANDIPHIIKAGADAALILDNNVTALHIAVSQNHIDCISPLLKASANVNAQTTEGHTPLHIAAESGDSDILIALLNANADCEIADSSGNTALHIAARNGRAECARELLKAGARIEVKNNINLTPFDFAAHTHSAELIRLFALHGCVKAQQALASLEEPTKVKSNVSLRSKITGFVKNTCATLSHLIPQKVKNVSYVLSQLGICLAIPYALDMPLSIMATSTLLACFIAIKKHHSALRAMQAGEILDSKELDPIALDPELVAFALAYTKSLAEQFELGEVKVIFDKSASNRNNALSSAFTNQIFINQELVTHTQSLEKLKGIIAHEIQHLHINRGWFGKGLKVVNKSLKVVVAFALQADFLSKVATQLSPWRIPYLTELLASRSFYTKERFAIMLLIQFFEAQMTRDEEYNADKGAITSPDDTSLETFLTDRLLCAKAQELATGGNEVAPSLLESDWYHNGWDTKQPLPYLIGLFNKQHPPIVDRLDSLRERRNQLRPR